MVPVRLEGAVSWLHRAAVTVWGVITGTHTGAPHHRHHAANEFRSVAALLAFIALGMLGVTMWRAVRVVRLLEHHRLGRYTILFCVAHGTLIMVSLIYLRQRYSLALTVAAPFAVVGYLATIWGLWELALFEESKRKEVTNARERRARQAQPHR